VREGDPVAELSGAVSPWDAFVELNTAQAPSPLVIEAPAGMVVDAPVVVCHWAATDHAVTFPRTLIRVGANARLTVVECHLSADVVAWVDPVTEIEVGDGGHLEHLVVQELGERVWQTAYVGALVQRDAGVRSFTVALGGDYARVRTDSRVVGAGGDAQLLALYCGNGTQMHDFRTLQDHQGPKSTSDLVFKGAVSDEARSAYSGLIRVRRGAAGTKAFQTNRNLILSDTGLATYSVPNLDIEENDVSCSHASATGPIDPDQRFYLESRGVPPEVAERLIVLGFFDDLLARLPVPGLRAHLGQVIGAKLALEGSP
jgi:Fe-S cluster assembly protein SufD